MRPLGLCLLVLCLLSSPVLATPFDFPITTYVDQVATGTSANYVTVTVDSQVFVINCWTNTGGLLDKICEEIAADDNARFVGFFPPPSSDALDLREITINNGAKQPYLWSTDACITGITPQLDDVYEVETFDGVHTKYLTCNGTNGGLLGRTCQLLEVGHCATFRGTHNNLLNQLVARRWSTG